jgi:hypothetical protein
MAIGDPANPKPLASYSMSGAVAVALDGDTIAAAGLPDGALGLSFFGVDGSGGAIVPIAAEGVTSISGLEIGAGSTYVTSHNYVGIVDARVPAAPHLAFDWIPPALTGNTCTVFVADGVGYFGAGWDGLYLFDLAEPAAPRLLGHWASPDWVIDVVVADQIAYLALGESGLATLDVSDPASPTMLGAVKTPGFAGHIDVADDHAFVGWFGEAGAMGGVVVVDVTDPATPALGESFRQPPVRQRRERGPAGLPDHRDRLTNPRQAPHAAPARAPQAGAVGLGDGSGAGGSMNAWIASRIAGMSGRCTEP